MQPRHVAWLLAVVPLLVALWPGAGAGHHPQAPDDLPSEVASVWFDQLYDLVKAEQITPPPASRIYGLAAVTLYEAVVPGSRAHRSLAGQLNALTAVPQPARHRRYHWPTVANSALAAAIRALLPAASPAAREAIDALEQAFAAAFQASVPAWIYTRSVAQGQAVAAAVVAWATTDGFAALNNCPYTPPVGPGLWEPTPPAFAPALQPCWGQLRPLVLASGEECAPPPPPAYADDPASEFFARALEVYTTNVHLTEEQRTIALYWADVSGTTGTPPGHWIAIVGQLAWRELLSLMAAAEGYVRVGLAVADAFISCWQTKYTYNLLRPETAITRLIDPAWVPLLITPGFPAYTSGHATQSGAAATVLTDLFGMTPFTDTLHQDHDLEPRLEPRRFGSFDEAAAEAAISRLYAGIHYPFDSDNGLAQGRCIGRVIVDRVTFTRSGTGGHGRPGR
jgi:membrane-associated phospholipid phosphatase